MFAFWFNAVFAFIYTYAAFAYPDIVRPFTIWAGGLHAGFAFSLAAAASGRRMRGEG